MRRGASSLTAVALIATLGAALCTTIGARSARADELATADGWAPLVQQRLAWSISLTATASLASGNILEPIVLSPDAIYGASDRVDLGVAHSAKRQTGFSTTRVPGGFCLRVPARGCPDVYDGPALLGRVRLASGAAELALDGGLVVVSFASPSALSAKLGLIARYHNGRVALWFHPNLFVGLTGREVGSGADLVPFNQERLHLPVALGLRLSPRLSIGLESGARGATDEFSDTFDLPLAATANLSLSDALGVGMTFGFETVLDHGTAGAGKSLTTGERTLSFVFTSRI